MRQVSVKALVVSKSIPRWLVTRALSKRFPRLSLGPTAVLGMKDVQEPALPGPDWVKVRTIMSGICGSDLVVVMCRGSLYLSGFTSFPLVPGHEVVAKIIEVGKGVEEFQVGERVAIEPALGCTVRGMPDLCPQCAAGRYANCVRTTEGKFSAGLQTGYCTSLPGGWGERFVVHTSQLHRVPDDFSDEATVLLEPLSCAIHGVLRAGIEGSGPVLVVGCGVVGLLTIAALRALKPECRIVAVAKYESQKRMAMDLGANLVCGAGVGGYGQLADEVGAKVLSVIRGKPAVAGGFSVVFECVGTSAALEDAMRWTMENGTLVGLGMPSDAKADLTPLWHQEVRFTGSYAYAIERTGDKEMKTFELAKDLMKDGNFRSGVSSLVSHRFPIKRYREAIVKAGRAGRLGGGKMVFTFPD